MLRRGSKISDIEYDTYELAVQAGQCLAQRGWMLVTAESCTGGWVGQAVTAVSGSSAWYERGYITYSNTAKCEMLGVQQATLDRHGAVSPQTAKEMAIGALNRSHAQISVSITGIAGPDGGTAEKPVGMVCFAWTMQDGLVQQETHYFTGGREAVRRQAVVTALEGVLTTLNHAAATA